MAFNSVPETRNSNTTTRLVSAATTNGTLVVAGGTRLEGIYAFNNTTTNKFLKLYDVAIAPVVGTDTPKITVMLPGTVATTSSSPVYITLQDNGIWFTSGLGFGITGAVGDADTTAVGAGDVYLTLSYMVT